MDYTYYHGTTYTVVYRSTAIPPESSLIQVLVSAFANRLEVPSSADLANGGGPSGSEDYPPVPVQNIPALIPVQQVGSGIGGGMDRGCPWSIASVHRKGGVYRYWTGCDTG